METESPGNAYGWVCPSLLELTSGHSLSRVLDIGIQNLVFALLNFSLALILVVSIPLFQSFKQ